MHQAQKGSGAGIQAVACFADTSMQWFLSWRRGVPTMNETSDLLLPILRLIKKKNWPCLLKEAALSISYTFICQLKRHGLQIHHPLSVCCKKSSWVSRVGKVLRIAELPGKTGIILSEVGTDISSRYNTPPNAQLLCLCFHLLLCYLTSAYCVTVWCFQFHRLRMFLRSLWKMQTLFCLQMLQSKHCMDAEVQEGLFAHHTGW